MARQFTPNAVLIPDRDEDDTPRTLHTSLPALLYIRRSTPGQEDNEGSLILQDERMEARLRRKGFTEFIKVAVDDLTSGQEIEREGLAVIKQHAKNRSIGALAAHNASRIWRDRTHIYDNQLIELLAAKRIPIILGNTTYWPNDKQQREKVQEEFKIAAQGLNQFDYYANPARVAIAELGRYAGHCVPIGYIVVGSKKNRHYQIYKPHADLIVWLFKRYKQLQGNLGRLGRELEASDFHFPDFEPGIAVPHIALPHDAIIEDRELFDYAYSRLSKYNLDGSLNENKPTVERHTAKVNALLEGLITNGSIPVYAMSNGTYTARETVNETWKTTALVIPIEKLDATFSKLMSGFFYFRGVKKGPELEGVQAKVKAVQEQTVERMGSLETDLANIRKGIRQRELDEKVSREAQDEKGCWQLPNSINYRILSLVLLIEAIDLWQSKHRSCSESEQPPMNWGCTR